MRPTVLAVIAALGLVALSVASSGCATSSQASAAGGNGVGASALPGNYKIAVHSRAFDGALRGTWKLHLKAMTYSFNYTGQTVKNVIISGTYSVAGDTIALRQRSAACSSKSRNGCRFIGCREVGTYRFARTNNTLSFAVVGDRCKARTAVLSGRFSTKA